MNFFRKGSLPKEEHFADLIDSSLNIIDEGFSKSVKEGLKIAPIGDSEKVISFFRNIEDKKPVWSVALDKKSGHLNIINQKEEAVVSLSLDGKIGIGTDQPQYKLDVDGVLAYKAKMGNLKTGKVPADGKWHPIISNLEGCQALEVMAGVGKRGSGNYALAHVIALNTFFSMRKIDVRQAYYCRMCNRLKFRWTGGEKSYNLEMRSRMSYGGDVKIKYHISKLWLDTFMDECISD